jgi:hypothetical protein
VRYSSVEWGARRAEALELSPKLFQDYRDGFLPEFVGRP